MKKLSDYKGEDAFELWADLMEPIVAILQDESITDLMRSGASKFKLAAAIMKTHKAEAEQIMTRIDPEPVNALNLVVRVIRFLSEIGSDPVIASFFGSQGQESKE